MASIQKYELKNGKERWMYVIENGTNPATGKRERIVKRGFLKEKEAIKAARAMEYEIDKWNLDFKNKATFRDLGEEWFERYIKSGVKNSTIRSKDYHLDKLYEGFGHVKVQNITQDIYQKFLFKLHEELSYNTLTNVHGTAKQVFKYAKEKKILLDDPTEFTIVPKRIKTVEEIENETITDTYFEKHELKAFLDVCYQSGKVGDFVFFSTLAWTGMRPGEALALKWSDIDFEEGTINITKTLYNPKNKFDQFELTPPKTDGSIRKIDIEEELIGLLIGHQLNQKKIKTIYEKHYKDFDFVFARLYGEFMGYPWYLRIVNRHMKLILNKMPNFYKQLTPHSFRHTHTSLLAEIDVPLELIMDRLGHDDEDTTKKIYLHVTQDRKKEASEKFGKLMRELQKT